jgi:hypothetical protein
MTGKHLLTVSLLLPFMAISSVVHADPTTTKKRHWAPELRSSRAQALPQADSNYGPPVESCAYQYQGGPKSNLWTCRPEYRPSHPGGR